MDKDKILEFVRSRVFLIIIVVVFALAFLSGIFSLGLVVGVHKARFSSNWAENYQKNFGGPRGMFPDEFNGRGFVNGHGVAGTILSVASSNSGQFPTLTIKGSDNIEKNVLIDSNTIVRKLGDIVQINDLNIDDFVVVIGEPNDSGQILAKFIREMPSPSPNLFRPMMRNMPR